MTDPIAELLAWLEAKAPLASLPRWAAAVRELRERLREAEAALRADGSLGPRATSSAYFAKHGKEVSGG